MKNLFKYLFVPSGEKVVVTAYESWIVRWFSVHLSYGEYTSKEKQAEVFTSKADAEKFANSLKDALKLLKNTNFDSHITIEQN